MEVKQVRRYPVPRYPTRIEVLESPDLLNKHIPSNWLRKAELAGLIPLFLSVNCELGKSILDPDLKHTDAAIVAPIFRHGDGRGTIGCLVINPPVFLSEEEALQVINEEFNNHGFPEASNDVHLSNIIVHHNRYKRYDRVNQEYVDIPAETKPLEVDYYLDEKRVAVEFVSYSAYDIDMFGEEQNYWSSLESFDFPECAEKLAQQVRENGRGVYFGVLYDPLSSHDCDDEWWDCNCDPRGKSLNYLREQVVDFVNWLKGQGVM